MFAQFITKFQGSLIAGLKREKRLRIRKDALTEQVRQVLKDSDQKLILMVRG